MPLITIVFICLFIWSMRLQFKLKSAAFFALTCVFATFALFTYEYIDLMRFIPDILKIRLW